MDSAHDDPFEPLAAADLVLDGITGIGGRGGLRPDAVPVARAARGSDAVVVAVDLPSGVDADTGEVAGEALRADVTVTFGTYKPGLLVDPARSYAGALRLVDIGLGGELPGVADLEALQHQDVARLLPVPGAETDKYRRGVLGIVAGSARYPGAAVLAVEGALRGGAGAVRYVGPAADAVIAAHPETLVHPGPPDRAGRVQAWVVGPGLGDEPGVAEVLASDVPVLVDADGLRGLDPALVRARSAPTVLTPHAGEAAALLGATREEVETGLPRRYGSWRPGSGRRCCSRGRRRWCAGRGRPRPRGRGAGEPDRHGVAGDGGQRGRPVGPRGLAARGGSAPGGRGVVRGVSARPRGAARRGRRSGDGGGGGGSAGRRVAGRDGGAVGTWRRGWGEGRTARP